MLIVEGLFARQAFRLHRAVDLLPACAGAASGPCDALAGGEEQQGTGNRGVQSGQAVDDFAGEGGGVGRVGRGGVRVLDVDAAPVMPPVA